MSDSYKHKLTSKNFAFLLIATMQEVTLLQLTRRTVEYSGRDAWLSILLCSSLAFASLFVINKLCARFPGLTLAEYSEKICGVVPGKIISFAFVLYTVVYAGLVVRLFVDVLNTYLLLRTPGWVLSLVMVLTITYIFSRDIRAIAWLSEFTTYIVQLLWILIIYGFSKASYQNLLPVGDMGLKNIISGFAGASFAYLGPEILLVIYPFIQNKKEVFKAGFWAIAFNAFTYTTIAIVVLMNFSGTGTSLFVWDFLALIKSYQLPLVERAEFFIVIFWSWLAIRSSSNHLYMAKHTIARAAGIKEKSHVYIIWLLAVLALAVSLFFQNTANAVLYTYPVTMAGVFMMLGLPAALWSVSAIRGVKES